MKKLLFILLFLIIGVLIGLCIPYSFFTVHCPTPLFPICSHNFWDWMLRSMQVFGTLLAVIVALFKEDWVAYRFKPNILLDKEHCDLFAKNVNGTTNRYDAKFCLSNVGRGKANNVRVVVERIDYRYSADRQNSQAISNEPYDLLIDKGSELSCIPTDDEIMIEWLTILQTPTPKPLGGKTPPVPPLNLMIGKKSIPSAHYNGILDVTIKIKCDELKPQNHVIRIEWDGTWRGDKETMQEVFSYKWLDCKQ